MNSFFLLSRIGLLVIGPKPLSLLLESEHSVAICRVSPVLVGIATLGQIFSNEAELFHLTSFIYYILFPLIYQFFSSCLCIRKSFLSCGHQESI